MGAGNWNVQYWSHSSIHDHNARYGELQKFLEHITIPSHLSSKQKMEICLKALSWQLVHGVLFWKHHNGVMLRCLERKKQRRLWRIYMIDWQVATMQATPQYTKSWGMIIIGPLFLSALTPMSASSKLVRNASVVIKGYPPHCSQLQSKNHSNSGALMLLERFFHTRQRNIDISSQLHIISPVVGSNST